MDFIDGNYTLVTEFILLGFPTRLVSPASDFVLYDFNGERWIDDANQGWSASSNVHAFFP